MVRSVREAAAPRGPAHPRCGTGRVAPGARCRPGDAARPLQFIDGKHLPTRGRAGCWF
jgi:hypothetical protein